MLLSQKQRRYTYDINVYVNALKQRTPYALYNKARNNAEFEYVKLKALLKDGLMKTLYVISIYGPQLLL